MKTILIVLVLILVLGGGYYLYNQSTFISIPKTPFVHEGTITVIDSARQSISVSQSSGEGTTYIIPESAVIEKPDQAPANFGYLRRGYPVRIEGVLGGDGATKVSVTKETNIKIAGARM